MTTVVNNTRMRYAYGHEAAILEGGSAPLCGGSQRSSRLFGSKDHWQAGQATSELIFPKYLWLRYLLGGSPTSGKMVWARKQPQNVRRYRIWGLLLALSPNVTSQT